MLAHTALQYVKWSDTAGPAWAYQRPVLESPRQPLQNRPLVIQLSINGEPRGFPAPLDLARLLDALALAGKKVAIERNGEIVPRSRYADTPLADGDRLEIVVAVGGG